MTAPRPDPMSETDHLPESDVQVAADQPDPGVGLRIDPIACVGPGRKDAQRLLVVWFIKKSFWWMFFGGSALAAVVHAIERVDNDFQVRVT